MVKKMVRIEVDEELAARLIRDSREFERLAAEAFGVSDMSVGESDGRVLGIAVKAGLERYAKCLEDRIAGFEANGYKK